MINMVAMYVNNVTKSREGRCIEMVNNDCWPFITKEGDMFVLGPSSGTSSIFGNDMVLSKRELKRLKRKLNEIDIDTFFWKRVK